MYSADSFLSLLPRTHFVGISAAYMHIYSVSTYICSIDTFLGEISVYFYISLPAKPTEAYIGHTVMYTNPLMSNKRNQCSNSTFLFLLNQQNYTPHEVSAAGGTNSRIKHSSPTSCEVSAGGGTNSGIKHSSPTSCEGSAGGGTNSGINHSPPMPHEGSAGGGNKLVNKTHTL